MDVEEQLHFYASNVIRSRSAEALSCQNFSMCVVSISHKQRIQRKARNMVLLQYPSRRHPSLSIPIITTSRWQRQIQRIAAGPISKVLRAIHQNTRMKEQVYFLLHVFKYLCGDGMGDHGDYFRDWNDKEEIHLHILDWAGSDVMYISRGSNLGIQLCCNS